MNDCAEAGAGKATMPKAIMAIMYLEAGDSIIKVEILFSNVIFLLVDDLTYKEFIERLPTSL
jgi:hypothetical protein